MVSEKLKDISLKIKEMNDKYNTDKVREETHIDSRKKLASKIEEFNTEKDQINVKISILQEASVEARDNAKNLLKNVCTNAVQMVLGDHLSVDIELDTMAQSATADIIVKSEYLDTIVEVDPAEEDGGGLADIVSLSSFLSINQLVGEENLAPLFLDEPTKYYFSKEHSNKTAEFLKEMQDYTGKQIFLVTHDEYLGNVGDVVYKFDLDETGTTTVTKI